MEKKLTNEQKIEIYNKVKDKVSVTYLSKKYNYPREKIYYFCRLIDRHGIDILEHKRENYSVEFITKAVERVVNGFESIKSVAIDIGLPTDTLLSIWVSNYQKNGYNVVKYKQKEGHLTMKKINYKPKNNETIEEKIKRLEEENLYLKAELEYSKKLEAVVQARKNRQQKKK